jgi:transcriptional regulator with XRE-family HTH domain
VGREPEIVTDRRRALGERLATFRQAACLTQGQLADRVFVDRTTVAHTERGRSRGTAEFWEAVDAALDARGALIRAYLDLEATRQAHERHSRDTELADARARADRLREQQAGVVSDQDGTVTPLVLAGSVTAGDQAFSMAALQAMSGAFQMADRKLGGGLLYGQVVRYIRAEIAPCLLDPPGSIPASDLFSAAASFAEIAGWMAHDSGQNERAQAHFGQSYHLATAARNVMLSANISASLSHLAIHLGQADDAIRISTAGLNRATRTETAGHLVARLHAMRARALALRGKTQECRRSLATAHALLEKNGGSSAAGWIAGFDRAALAAESALCLYTLGALAEAEAEARTVIALRVGDRVRSRALGQITLARILVKAGRIDEAATIATEVCTVTSALNSARVHTGLADLAEALTAHRSVPEVTGFLDRLTEYQHERAPARVEASRWPL